MDQGHRLAAGLKGVLDGHAHQTLGRKHRDRFNSHPRIRAHLLLAAFEHFFVEKLDQLRSFSSSLLPFDSGIHIFGVLAEDDDVHTLGMFDWRWRPFVVLHRAHATIKIEHLPQCDIERPNSTTHRRGKWPFYRDSKLSDSVNRILRQPVIELRLSFFSRKNLVPCDSPLPAVCFFRGSIENSD